MRGLDTPIGQCIAPPCYTLGQALEVLMYFVAAVLVLVAVLALFTKVLGGRFTRAAQNYEAPSGAFGLSGWAMAGLDWLPRAWRDETFYEELRDGSHDVGKAAGEVAIAAAVVVALSAVAIALSGRATESLQLLVVALAVAFAIWAVFGTVASVVARILFGRRQSSGPTFVALGFAISPLVLVLLALAFVSVFGLLLVLFAASWALALCYFAIRGTMQTDEFQTLGITASIVLAGFALFVLTQFAFGPRIPAEVAVCDGLVDASGGCTPMAELSPAIQTAIAVQR
jgi:Yip1 domain